MSIGRIDINERDQGKINTAIIQIEERLDPITPFITTLLDDVDAATARATLGVGLVPLSVGTASNSAQLDFTGISSTYDTYLFYAVNLVPATNSVELWLRTSQDGGTSFAAGAATYKWAAFVTTDGAGNASTGSTGDTKYKILSANVSNLATRPTSLQLRLFGPSGTAGPKNIASESTYINDAGNLLYSTSSGAYTADNNAINAVRFMTSTGNITSGVIYMYGVRKT